MALLASLGKSGRGVRRIVRRLEIVQVATHAGRVRRGQVVVAIHVARRASHGGMRSRQRESGRRVIERSTTPVRGVVALLASLREVRLYVVRICCSLEVRQVAARAGCICGGQVVVAVNVALHALQGNVCAGQRESGGGVVEGRIAPGCRGMALLARLRELRLEGIRIGGAV